MITFTRATFGLFNAAELGTDYVGELHEQTIDSKTGKWTGAGRFDFPDDKEPTVADCLTREIVVRRWNQNTTQATVMSYTIIGTTVEMELAGEPWSQ
jgi:hypothetical protein